MIQKNDVWIWSYRAIRCVRYVFELFCKVIGALFLRSINNVWAYIRAPEIWVLVLVLWVLFVIATVDQILAQKIFSRLDSAKDIPEKLWVCVKCGWQHGFKNLFSLPQDDVRIVPRLIYFVTWLVGGGALVGSILSTSKRFVKGEWRKWPWLVRNHTVVLGWDANVPTRIREHLASRKLWKLYFPETFYVLSSADTEDIRRALHPIFGWWHPTINLYVYKGVYDDANELNGLRLPRANEVIVVGEDKELVHDSRVMSVPKAIYKTIQCKWYNRLFCLDRFLPSWWRWDPFICRLKINDIGLYWQQLGKQAVNDVIELPKIGYVRRMEIRYENFHDSWAKRLFSGPDAMKIKFDTNLTERARVLILGFGAMGKAVAVELLNRADPASTLSIKIALASRDDLAYEWNRFKVQFSDLLKCKRKCVEVVADPSLRMESISTLQMLRKEILKSYRRPLTIIVALKKAEKGLALALSIKKFIDKLKSGTSVHVRMAISQEMSGSDEKQTQDGLVLNGHYVPMRFFGMADGAGYNEWSFDRKAYERFCDEEDLNPFAWFSRRSWLMKTVFERGQKRREVLNAGC